MTKRNLKIAILGLGRVGKDTAGAYIGNHSSLRYMGSTSNIICPIIAKHLGISEKEAWTTRHDGDNRMFWYNFCNEYRRDDPTKLARISLEVSDMVVGLRDKREFDACKEAGLFDLTIWINRDVAPDPTVTFRREDCDVIIDNTGSFEQYYHKLDRLIKVLNI